MIWVLILWFLFHGPVLPAPPPIEGQVDRIVVDKSDRLMMLYQGDRPVRVYPVALGGDPVGPKQVQGDGRTPEGTYLIDRRNGGSAFHLSLGLDYPHPDQRAAARRQGRSPGGDIFIHGQPNAMPVGFMMRGDWTDGCIAVSNAQIEELWRVTRIGTVVEVRP